MLDTLQGTLLAGLLLAVWFLDIDEFLESNISLRIVSPSDSLSDHQDRECVVRNTSSKF